MYIVILALALGPYESHRERKNEKISVLLAYRVFALQ